MKHLKTGTSTPGSTIDTLYWQFQWHNRLYHKQCIIGCRMNTSSWPNVSLHLLRYFQLTFPLNILILLDYWCHGPSICEYVILVFQISTSTVCLYACMVGCYYSTCWLLLVKDKLISYNTIYHKFNKEKVYLSVYCLFLSRLHICVIINAYIAE